MDDNTELGIWNNFCFFPYRTNINVFGVKFNIRHLKNGWQKMIQHVRITDNVVLYKFARKICIIQCSSIHSDRILANYFNGHYYVLLLLPESGTQVAQTSLNFSNQSNCYFGCMHISMSIYLIHFPFWFLNLFFKIIIAIKVINRDLFR